MYQHKHTCLDNRHHMGSALKGQAGNQAAWSNNCLTRPSFLISCIVLVSCPPPFSSSSSWWCHICPVLFNSLSTPKTLTKCRLSTTRHTSGRPLGRLLWVTPLWLQLNGGELKWIESHFRTIFHSFAQFISVPISLNILSLARLSLFSYSDCATKSCPLDNSPIQNHPCPFLLLLQLLLPHHPHFNSNFPFVLGREISVASVWYIIASHCLAAIPARGMN